MGRLTKKYINEKVKQAIKQGFIFVKYKEIEQIKIKKMDKRCRCFRHTFETICGMMECSVYWYNYNNGTTLSWALTREELEK